MSEKVSSALAAQLHAHSHSHSHSLALANSSSSSASASAEQQQQSLIGSREAALTFETDAPAAAISAQLNFKIVPMDSLMASGMPLGLGSSQEMFGSMNTSQISNASTESSCSPPAAAAPPKPSRHMAVQPLNSVRKREYSLLNEIHTKACSI